MENKEYDMRERVAVVIPYYHSELTKYEKISFQNCISVLGRYPIILLIPQKIPKEKYPSKTGLHFEIVSDSYFESVESYNQLMVSMEFYQLFNKYEYILIFQLDAFVFSDSLMKFCDMGYDYIGAPWINGVKYLKNKDRGVYYVGNGGLSLRKVISFLRVLDNENIKHINIHEDLFWAIHDSEEFQVAPVDVALKFSIEKHVQKCFRLNSNKIPFGCHAWEKYDFEFWNPFFQDMGYDIGSDVIGGYDMKCCNETDYHYLDLDKEIIGRHITELICEKKIATICIFGAGEMGKECCWLLQRSKICSMVVVDNNPQLYKKRLWDKEIVSPEILKPMKMDVFIIIAVNQAKKDLLSQVENYGYMYGENVIFYEELIKEFIIANNYRKGKGL